MKKSKLLKFLLFFLLSILASFLLSSFLFFISAFSPSLGTFLILLVLAAGIIFVVGWLSELTERGDEREKGEEGEKKKERKRK